MTAPDRSPGVFKKGDRVRRASTPADVVALEFEGYRRVVEGEQASEPQPHLESTPTPDFDDDYPVDVDDF